MTIDDKRGAPHEPGHDAGRHDFHLLLAANPNYFGTFPGFGFDPVEPKAEDTFYEEVTCVAYSPERDRVEATIAVKRSAGYSGGPCSAGSFEYVRFYIDYGSGWEDLGRTGVDVHDLPAGTDCFGSSTHPLSYVCGVAHQPRRNWCGSPVLPTVRAILSWNLEPPPGQPDWRPVWGGVHECRVQIRPRTWFFGDIASLLSADVLAKVPASVLEASPDPAPDPGPKKALSLQALAEHYRGADVPAHRFALPTVLTAPGFSTGTQFLASATSVKEAGVNLAEILKALQGLGGDTEYEELECLGLDSALFGGSLVATFRVKRSSGYSGPPCSAGSTEYVAFWADWGDECEFRHLGTVPVVTHDYEDIGDGLCYAAILPVELGRFVQECGTPNLRRVRAVLSWSRPPSTTDPDEMPYWGNRVDAHVQIPAGQPYDGLARFWKVGGVASHFVDSTTGLTTSGAVLGVATLLPDACPFAGTVILNGRQDPALTGQPYRIVATNLDQGGTRILTTPFTVTRYDSGTNWYVPQTITPDPVDGWLPWPAYLDDLEGILGVFTPGGDDRWSLSLELGTAGNQVDQATVQMDNTVRDVVDLSDPLNAGDLRLDTEGMCQVPHGIVTGTFVARDAHFRQWSISVTGGPGDGSPQLVPPAATGILATDQTPLGGTAFSLDFSNPLIAPCGYVVRLTISDKAIVDSVIQDHAISIDRGLCLTQGV